VLTINTFHNSRYATLKGFCGLQSLFSDVGSA